MADSRLGLNAQEFIYFTAQAIACGEWPALRLDRQAALDLLSNFAESIYPASVDPDLFTESIYETVQNSMLASSGFDFETLQLFPPFNDFGKRNLAQLLSFRQKKGAEAMENNFKRTFREGWEARRPPKEIIRVVSGDGETIETPVKFSTDEVEKRVRAEYWFVTFRYGKENENWERGVHYTVCQPQTFQMISKWDIKLADGQAVNVYFNTNRER